jgi:hypothetical protein
MASVIMDWGGECGEWEGVGALAIISLSSCFGGSTGFSDFLVAFNHANMFRRGEVGNLGVLQLAQQSSAARVRELQCLRE